jgi:Protein of unknown function (DUF3095)
MPPISIVRARPASPGDFYHSLPVFIEFSLVLDPTLYRPLPPGWLVGMADVVGSTKAIAAGRYKAVNMAGASVIAAVSNAIGRMDYPFVFGGDGASFAVAPEHATAVARALAATAAWTQGDLGLTLRVALVPVETVRAAGHDVAVARYAPSPHVSYAMFSGGGLTFVEKEMKRGAIALEPAPAGSRPDLTGLSCRWAPIVASRGTILSLIVMPAVPAGDPRFRALVDEIFGLLAQVERAGHPIPLSGPPMRWPPKGIDLEARASRLEGQSLFWLKARLMAFTLMAAMFFWTGRRAGAFDPAKYTAETVVNTDFCKFDDGLRLTIDCTTEWADKLEVVLRQAEEGGIIRFGTHRQSEAQITCIVPSAVQSDHIHFVDGASGGYAAAAQRLKSAMTKENYLTREN